jgi:hypothetical protein
LPGFLALGDCGLGGGGVFLGFPNQRERKCAMAVESSREGKARREFDVQELLKNLNLHEAELKEVILEKEEIKNWPEVKWLVAARVLTNKSFSMEALKRTMKSAWATTKEVTFHAVEDNMFVLQVSCLRDWNRVMNDGPWIFRQQGVMVEPYDGVADLNTVVLNLFVLWMWIWSYRYH